MRSEVYIETTAWTMGRRAAPFAWGLGGFLIGAVFWHAVGFWGFLGDVVLKGPETSVSIARAPLPAGVANCTTLALNRATGETLSVPCIEQMPLLEEARLGRQDLALAMTSRPTRHLN